MKNEIKTIALSGSEECVTFPGDNCDMRNDGTDVVYASCTKGIVPAADGVLSIPAGSAAKMIGCGGRIYLLGTGSVLCVGNDSKELVFKTAAAAGGSGEDTAARTAISAHSGSKDIHHSTAELQKMISNPNLLINPDFRIVQNKAVSYADCWVGACDTDHGGVTFSQSGQYIVQMIEGIDAFIGMEATATVYYDDGTYDSGTNVISAESPYFFAQSRTHCLMYQNGGIKGLEIWASSPCRIVGAKLECGSHSTGFFPPDPATELMKCQRRYEKLTLPENSFTPVFQKPGECDRVVFSMVISPKANNRYSVSTDASSARVYLNGNAYEITGLETTNLSMNCFEVEAVLSAPTDQPISGWIEGITFEISAEV